MAYDELKQNGQPTIGGMTDGKRQRAVMRQGRMTEGEPWPERTTGPGRSACSPCSSASPQRGQSRPGEPRCAGGPSHPEMRPRIGSFVGATPRHPGLIAQRRGNCVSDKVQCVQHSAGAPDVSRHPDREACDISTGRRGSCPAAIAEGGAAFLSRVQP